MDKEISIRFIGHNKQRYDTYGDYYYGKEKLNIRISKFSNWKYQWLVLLHEMVEFLLIMDRGITIEEIERFDLANLRLEDPGLSKEAPYHKEHMTAIKIEKILCKELGLKWGRYYNTKPMGYKWMK